MVLCALRWRFTVIRFGLLLCLALAASGCWRNDVAEMPNGYKIWVMNSREIYLANMSNELVVGFAIANVGVDRHIVVVECAERAVTVNGFSNMSGYTIVDTASGLIDAGLDRNAFERKAKEIGFPVSAMRPVSDFF